jgi:DNA-binding XRE family transcriptional regulator
MTPKPKLPEPMRWKDPAYLKRVREGVGLSQANLAKESGLSRSVIANIESGRTILTSVDDALLIYRSLASIQELRALLDVYAMQQARHDAIAAVVELLQIKKAGYPGRIAELGRHIKQLEREATAYKGWLADVETEEIYWQEQLCRTPRLARKTRRK